MNVPNNDSNSLAEAVQWVSQITAIAMEMVVPVLLGRWMDQYWGTSYWILIGAAVGPPIGFWHLLTLTGVVGGRGEGPGNRRDRQS